MDNFFVNNRQVITDLALNTGSSSEKTFTKMCTTTETTLGTDFEQQDFYTFCDAIQRSIITGVALSIETTVKLDINNEAIQTVLAKIHTLLTSGEIAQFNNETIQFNLLTGVTEGTLEYTTYQVPAILNFSELGGSAEDASEFSLTIVINGKGTVVTAQQ